MRSSAAVCSLVFTAGVLAGCPDRSIDLVTPQQGRVEAKDTPVNVNRNLDLLFLIDNSPSMRDKQVNLADNFPRFIDVLQTIPGGLPSLHIGVVTSDMGTKGADDAAPGPKIGDIGQGGCASFGDHGNLQAFGAPIGSDVFISDVITDPVTGARSQNYTGTLASAFSAMAKGVGANGCGFEQHLEAVKQALQPSNAVNQNFLRKGNPATGEPEAYLGVIIIADEDDCSLAHSSLLKEATGSSDPLGPQRSFRCTRFGVTCDDGGQTPDAMNLLGDKARCHPNDGSDYLTKISGYADFLKQLKSDPAKVIVAGIMGTTAPFHVEIPPGTTGSDATPTLTHSCSYVGGDNNGDGKPDTEVADPPVRLKSFLDQFPSDHNTLVSICQQDLSSGLKQIGDLLKAVIGDPCIEGKLADVDPETPGRQYSCAISVITNEATAAQDEVILPRCTPEDASATNQPCWHLVVDGGPPYMKCPNSEHFILKIEGQSMLPTDAIIRENCVTEVTNG